MAIEPMRWNEAEDGALSIDTMREKLERLGCTVCLYTYPPGTVFPPHTHAMDKIDGVLSGRFMMTMQGRSMTLGAGDMLPVPKGILHRAEVIGDEPVVSLDGTKA